MANTQSTWIQNRIASPIVLNNPAAGEMANTVWNLVVLAIPAGVATNDTAEILRVPAQARIFHLDIANQSLATTATTDVGLFKALASGSPAFATGAANGDSSALSTGIALGTGNVAFISRYGTGNKPTIANMGKQAWELAGLATNPELSSGGVLFEFALLLTFTSIATPTGGSVAVRLGYQTH